MVQARKPVTRAVRTTAGYATSITHRQAVDLAVRVATASAVTVHLRILMEKVATLVGDRS
jgi:hypothetical protein